MTEALRQLEIFAKYYSKKEDLQIDCWIIIFRNILNEYSTGWCIVACAFIRYCKVCYPTSTILTKRTLRQERQNYT